MTWKVVANVEFDEEQEEDVDEKITTSTTTAGKSTSIGIRDEDSAQADVETVKEETANEHIDSGDVPATEEEAAVIRV